jgi:anti-sigma regulatory factor (Ser/Thr protein kinase)
LHNVHIDGAHTNCSGDLRGTNAATVASGLFEHRAVFYEGADGFLAATLPFVTGALAGGEAVLAALAPQRCEQLREALGERAGDVEFADVHELGRNPARMIPAWQRFLDEHRSDAPVRGIGEPVWPGRSAAELEECDRHEHLLNVAFAEGRPWRLLCPYDTDTLPPATVHAARMSHPALTAEGACERNPGYAPRADFFARTPLAAPPASALELRFGRAQLASLREAVYARARAAEMPQERCEDLVLAVNELAVNSVQHGGGTGTLSMWTDEQGRLLCEVRDAGVFTQPLAGCVLPAPERLGGRGLWLANQVCDLVQIRSAPRSGTAVRVCMAAG